MEGNNRGEISAVKAQIERRVWGSQKQKHR